MQFSHFFAACLAVRVAMGYLVAPPAGSSPAPETTEECSAWVVVNSAAMTCASICTEFDITLASFEEMVRSWLSSSLQCIMGVEALLTLHLTNW
jgi:hypothetical protein